MARIRTIKPEFFTDSKTGHLSGPATRLFLGMLNHADDCGVLRLNYAELRAKILPYEESIPGEGTPTLRIVGVPLFDELVKLGLVQLFMYRADDEDVGQLYLFIVHFLRHQRISHPGEPLIKGMQHGETPDEFAHRTGADQLEPCTLPPSPSEKPPKRSRTFGSVPEGSGRKGKERKGEEGRGQGAREEETAR
jgi:hypothetical protein